ncbi:MAG: hypothetical protein U0871_04375 [Gemmataceae bacterium]
MDVTPERFPVSVNGGFTDRTATRANDRLHARCLVLDDGRVKLALVVVDSCMLPRELVASAKRLATDTTGIPTDHILISATHTHTAPTATGVFQSEPDPRYVEFLTRRIADGIKRAADNLAPAEVGWGVSREPGEVFNRRWRMKPDVLNRDPFGGTSDRVRMNPGHQNPGLQEPAGTTDPEVSVLAVRTPAGRPLALFANYSLHYVGDLPPLSADYFGVFAERVGPLVGATDPGFVGILSNGTSGDVNNIDYRNPPRKSQPGERCRAVAEAVARSAAAAYKSATFRADATLAAATEELELHVRKPTPADLQRANDILSKAGRRVLQSPEEVYARETVLLDKYPDTVRLKLQALRVGGLGIAAVPCEVFTQIGLDIKARSPIKPTFTVSLANGYNGYLPTPAQHALGGYETWRARSSYLEVEASDKIVPVVVRLLDRVKPEKSLPDQNHP